MRHIIIIGNGIAGNSAASAIREVDKEVAITLISQEAVPEYSPCALPKKYLSGEMRKEELFLKRFEDYSREGIKALLGQKVVGINVESKKVILEAEEMKYDKLVIATGSKPVLPPLGGRDKEGVFTLKSLADAEEICRHPGKRVVIIGAGALGVETSIALRKRGWEVSMIVRSRVMRAAFDEKASLLLGRILEDYGVKLFLGERVTSIEGDGQVEGVITDKREIEADKVILALGMEPNIELAQKAGIGIGELGGIKVNRQMMTDIEDIYACGDCVEVPDMITGKNTLSLLWHNAKQQGQTAGYNCLGVKRSYPGALDIVSVNASGKHAVSIGHTAAEFKDQELKTIEGENKFYYRLLAVEGVLVGAQFIGKTEDLGPLLSMLRRGDRLDKLQSMLANEVLLAKNPWSYRLASYFT